MKEMKRILSLVLALVLVVGLLPAAALKAEAAVETGAAIDAAVVFTDLHTNKSDYKEDDLTDVLAAIQAGMTEAGVNITSVTSGGDAFSVNEDTSSSNGPYTGKTATLNGYIEAVLGDVDINYVWSDHDRYAVLEDGSTLLDKTSHVSYGKGADGKLGTADDGSYYVYSLSMGDLCSYDRYKAGFNYTESDNSGRVAAGFTATVPEAIANFKADAAEMDKTKPLLIVSHQPLFDNRNDNAWAEAWFEAINTVAEEMDVVFFFGHNHKYDDKTKDYYYAKGSDLPVATASNWGFDYDVGEGYLPSMDLASATKQKINFTHLCGGYLEPTSTGSYKDSTTRKGTAMGVTIYENAIGLTTYDKDGVYDGSIAPIDVLVERDHEAAAEAPEEPTTEPTTEPTEPSSAETTQPSASEPGSDDVQATTVYVLVDAPVDGGKYLISNDDLADTNLSTDWDDEQGVVAVNDDDALSYEFIEVLSDSITAADGTVYSDGYIELDEDDAVWTAQASGSGFTFENDGKYINGADVSDSAATWTYANNRLTSGSKYLYFSYINTGKANWYWNTTSSASGSSTRDIFFYKEVEVKVEGSNPDPDEPTTPDVPETGGPIADSNGTGITVSAPGLTAVAASKIEDPSYDAQTYTAYASFDIDVEGYTQGDKATVSIPAPADFDPDRAVLVLDNGEVIATTSIKDGKITFITDHFSIYDVAQVDAEDVTAWDPVEETKTIFRLTDTLTADKKYVIVSTNAAGTGTAVNLNGNSINSQTVTVIADSKGNYIEAPGTTAQWTFTNGSKLQSVSNTGRYLSRSADAFSTTNRTSSEYTTWSYSITNGLRARKTSSSGTYRTASGYYIYVEDSLTVGTKYYGAAGLTQYTIAIGEYDTQAEVVEMIRNNYKIYQATGANGEGAEELQYTLTGTVNPGTEGTYTLTASAGSITQSIKVTVELKSATAISVADADKAITVERDTLPSARKIKATLTYSTGETEEVMLPLSMLTGTLNLEANGTYGGLSLKYGTLDAVPGFTVTVIDKQVSDEVNFPKYPAAGAVELTKTASPLDQDTGTTRIELSTAGLSYSQGVDVIVMLDTSSSMDRCTSCGEYTGKDSNKSDKCSCTNPTNRIDELKDALETLESALRASPNASNIKIAIADFNGDVSGATALSSTDRTKDAPVLGQTGTVQVYTDTSGNDLDANSFVSAADLDVSTFTIKGYTGTNYDYAFDAIYRLGTAIKEANGENQRPLYVIFMSDGAPNQFNYYGTTGGTGTSATVHDWNIWLQGLVGKEYTDEDGNKRTENMSDVINSTTHSYYYDEEDRDGDGFVNEHRMANAIKGDPNETYEVIRKTNDLGTATGEDNMYMVPGLGATVYSLAFYVSNDGNITETSAKHALSQTASDGEEFYVDASSGSALTSAFKNIAGTIAKAAENAVFTDQLGDNFKLQMVQNAPNSSGGTTTLNTDITVTAYDVVTEQMVAAEKEVIMSGETTARKVTNADVGKVYGSPTVLETVEFTSETEATSDKLTGNIINSDGVICAKTFYYNTTSTAKVVDGKTIEPETFVWNVGTVNEQKITLSYLVYLEGSIEGTRNPGSYATNNYAKMQYINWIGNTVEQEVSSPGTSWESATVSYAFYLVDSEGNPLYANGDRAPNFGLAYKVTNPVVAQEVLLNSDGESNTITFDTIDTSVLPAGYVIYDEGATYSVTSNSGSGGGSWMIEGTKSVITTEDGSTSSTYVTGYYGDEYSNVMSQVDGTGYSYAATTVWFAVEWKEGVVNDTVVIDYGLPVDISVLANDMLGVNGKLVAVGQTADKPTDPGINGGFRAEPDAAKFTNSVGVTFGTATVNDTKVRYRLSDKNMAMNSYDQFTYVASAGEGKENTHYYYGDVTVIPATTVYYEDSFVTLTSYTDNVLDSTSKWTPSAASNATQAEDRPGKYSLQDANNVYGYDGAYRQMSTHSLNSAAKITVDAATRGEATFTFYGTGFDVISMTSNTTGTMTVQVYQGNAATSTAYKTKIVDTYYGYKKVDGKWVIDNETENTLYQIPVIKFSGMPYGQYTVKITAGYNDFFNHTNTAGSYDLYLDAIRIYDPTGNQDETSNKAYTADGEGWPKYQELRNLIIAANDFNASENGEQESGAIFIDHVAGTYTIADYTSYGPNNELYLASGQAVAFELDMQDYVNGTKSIVADVQLGVKSADGNPVQITMTTDGNSAVRDFATTTDMYYSFKHMLDLGTKIGAADGKNDSKTTVVIENTGSGIASITNIKTTFTEMPGENTNARIGYDRTTGEEALVLLSGSPDDVILKQDGPAISLKETYEGDPTQPQEEAPKAEAPAAPAPETAAPETAAPVTPAPQDQISEEALFVAEGDSISLNATYEEAEEEAPAAESVEDAPAVEAEEVEEPAEEAGFSLKAIFQRIKEALSMLLSHLFK